MESESEGERETDEPLALVAIYLHRAHVDLGVRVRSIRASQREGAMESGRERAGKRIGYERTKLDVKGTSSSSLLLSALVASNVY